MSKFDVYPFDRALLSKVIADCNMSFTSEEVDKDKWFNYLHAYLSYPTAGFTASVFIVEPKYVSEAYLGDYLSHYSTKFKEYPKFTYRIHFFDTKLSHEDVLQLLGSKDKDQVDTFWEGYIGYTVIKPVANSIFGATLLKPYEDKAKSNRKYPATTWEEVHFLGRTIKIRALGYQQQDVAVGVCATNSLWCAFHKTSRLFGTDLPSPHNITKSSLTFTGMFDDFENVELGLTFGHISQAIRNLGMGLDRLYSGSETTGLDHPTLRKYVYGYCKAEIPVLLGYQHQDKYHLVTICGYRTAKTKSQPISRGEFAEYADCIDRLYVHDDLIGPYAKMEFTNDTFPVMKRNDDGKLVQVLKSVQTLATHFIDGSEAEFKGCIPNMLIIPLERTISVKLEGIRSSVKKFHNFFFRLEDSDLEPFSCAEWKIYLQSGIDYKKSFEGAQRNETIDKILLTSYPLYVWVGRMVCNGEVILDIVYDATDDNRGFCCFQFNLFENKYKTVFFDYILMELRRMREKAAKGLPKAKNKDSLSRKHINFMILALIADGLEIQYYGRFNVANNLVEAIE